MKSDDIFFLLIWPKVTYFVLYFQLCVLCVVVEQKLYEKIALTERNLLIC